jgi:hypothetical protein
MYADIFKQRVCVVPFKLSDTEASPGLLYIKLIQTTAQNINHSSTYVSIPMNASRLATTLPVFPSKCLHKRSFDGRSEWRFVLGCNAELTKDPQ